MNSFFLKDKVVVITGGKGITGYAFADATAGAGGAIGLPGRLLSNDSPFISGSPPGLMVASLSSEAFS